MEIAFYMGEKIKIRHYFGSIFLIVGTAIGGGMLAFPITTGIAGFFPALFHI